ncbi:hypothetical protein DFJ74DRAFT_470976 [Hyaloraphidium curvatum]|nr:hypothetical protein DFJ74DRAFT_470976 [Hyaloraphidium curvatum]
MAAVQLKLGEWNKAIRAADQALNVDDKNVKALFRRAMAELGNDDLDLAEADFKKVVALDPADPAPRAELQKIKERRKELEKKSKSELSGMFNRGSLS